MNCIKMRGRHRRDAEGNELADAMNYLRYELHRVCMNSLQSKHCGVTGSHLIVFYLSVTLARASSPKIGEPRALAPRQDAAPYRIARRGGACSSRLFNHERSSHLNVPKEQFMIRSINSWRQLIYAVRQFIHFSIFFHEIFPMFYFALFCYDAIITDFQRRHNMDYFELHNGLHSFFTFPKFILNFDLTPVTMIVYMRLYDRNFLSKRSGWADEQGRIYIIYPVKELANDARCNERTVMKALGELEKLDLIERRRMVKGGVNRIYVKCPWLNVSDRPTKSEMDFLLTEAGLQ